MKIFATLLLSASLVSAWSQQPGPKKSVSAAKAQPRTQDPGRRAFEANCSRCHSAPEQVSPRIAGTVLRHMRVRASLSAADEKAILRYFVP
jgi:cytochrome c5